MATLASTGAVNLTASTNWSPAQIPQAGDDLILAGHQLTLDADITLGSVTFTVNGSSRLVISGTTRIVNATNGLDVRVTFSGVLINTTLTPGMDVTIRGTWYSTTTNGGILAIAQSTGGNLTLATIGDNPAGVLFADPFVPTVARVLAVTWTGGTLTTIGRFSMPMWTAASVIMSMSGGVWTHASAGSNLLGNGNHVLVANTGANSTFNWSGDLVSASTSAALMSFSNASQAVNITGGSIIKRTSGPANANLQSGTAHGTVLRSSAAAVGCVINLDGVLCSSVTSRSIALDMASSTGGRLNWRNQSCTIASGDSVVIWSSNTVVSDLTNLQVLNAGRFQYYEVGAASVVVDAATLITNTTTSAQACVISNAGALDGKVVNLSSDILRIPTADEVSTDADPFGYTASPITPTGLIVDPAVIAAAAGAAMTAALNSISTTALARFVSVNTGQTTAVDGSVAKLAQGGTVDLSSVLDKLPVSGRAATASELSVTVNPTALSSISISDIRSGLATETKQDDTLAAIAAIDSGSGMTALELRQALFHADDVANKLRVSAAGEVIAAGGWAEEQIQYAMDQLGLLTISGSTVVIPSGELMCTRGDVEQVFGTTSVAAWADLNNTGDADDIAARINYRIAMADNYVRSVLASGPWNMPEPGDIIPAILAYNVAALTGVYLYEARGIQDYNAAGHAQHQLSYHKKNVEDFLKGVLVGTINLKPLTYSIMSAAPEAS